mmetsp:Transcript_25855/g.72097  ORF Transcript_25855/g.72097 Transcript_25855/m.72097 type:complete len:279 (+) Transcript_25855:645-1481(+)
MATHFASSSALRCLTSSNSRTCSRSTRFSASEARKRRSRVSGSILQLENVASANPQLGAVTRGHSAATAAVPRPTVPRLPSSARGVGDAPLPLLPPPMPSAVPSSRARLCGTDPRPTQSPAAHDGPRALPSASRSAAWAAAPLATTPGSATIAAGAIPRVCVTEPVAGASSALVDKGVVGGVGYGNSAARRSAKRALAPHVTYVAPSSVELRRSMQPLLGSDMPSRPAYEASRLPGENTRIGLSPPSADGGDKEAVAVLAVVAAAFNDTASCPANSAV